LSCGRQTNRAIAFSPVRPDIMAMTTMIAEVYDALVAAGSPEDKARKAAEAIAGYETGLPGSSSGS
jgi:hypothetical protein